MLNDCSMIPNEKAAVFSKNSKWVYLESTILLLNLIGCKVTENKENKEKLN